jgi:hypothetical protein
MVCFQLEGDVTESEIRSHRRTHVVQMDPCRLHKTRLAHHLLCRLEWSLGDIFGWYWWYKSSLVKILDRCRSKLRGNILMATLHGD